MYMYVQVAMCFIHNKTENEKSEMKEYSSKGLVDSNMHKTLNCKPAKWKLIVLLCVLFVLYFMYMYICAFNNHKVERVTLQVKFSVFRLQAELEEARKQAQEEMFLELEKAKREAEMEWNSRKTGYEDKLIELEQSRQEAQEFIQKLQKQKMVSYI